MKIPLLSTLAVLSVSSLLVGCGGGGGDDSDEPRTPGTWTGALVQVENTCPGSTSPATLNFRHVVNQNEEAVTLVDNNGRSFLGNLVGDSGFSVDATSSGTFGGTTCSLSDRIEYSEVFDNDDATADIDFTSVRTCPNGTSCRISYSGTGSRNIGLTPVPNATVTPGGAPTATPGSSTTPIAGGCPAMNTRPAAGVFQGNGGCGISETVFRLDPAVNSTTVVLEPFGANGATSFAINAANPSAATSNRTDLTVQNEAGYSCSVTCSPPGTFTVSCFKEGGTQCTEKF